MSSKAERTTAYIIETVAPIFNRQGYIGTSLSDLTEATGLTKGAIYGNFDNKERIAIQAYHHNSQRLLNALRQIISNTGDVADILLQITSFYRNYDLFTKDMGGCPLINTGIDALYNNRGLSQAVSETVRNIETDIAELLDRGMKSGKLKLTVAPIIFARQFFTMIQGAVTMYTLMQDRKYLVNTMNYLDLQLQRELFR
jgi:TetR/AcrR family transcriptional repressor of nem operon